MVNGDVVMMSELQEAIVLARREGRAFGFRPPWHRLLPGFRSPALKLHTEVVLLAKMLEPTLEEAEGTGDEGRCERDL